MILFLYNYIKEINPYGVVLFYDSLQYIGGNAVGYQFLNKCQEVYVFKPLLHFILIMGVVVFLGEGVT